MSECSASEISSILNKMTGRASPLPRPASGAAAAGVIPGSRCSTGNQGGAASNAMIGKHTVLSCGTCQINLKEREKYVICDLCGLGFHIKCQSVSPQLHKTLASEDGSRIGLHWYCNICQRGTQSLFTHVAKFNKEQELIKTDVESLKIQNDAIYKELLSFKESMDNI